MIKGVTKEIKPKELTKVASFTIKAWLSEIIPSFLMSLLGPKSSSVKQVFTYTGV